MRDASWGFHRREQSRKGANSGGQLGTGTAGNPQLTPVELTGIDNVTSVAVGHGHSLVIDTDGSLWAWGSNSVGQLGDGTTTGLIYLRNRYYDPPRASSSQETPRWP